MERRISSVRESRLERTKSEIARRIRAVCPDMPEEEFDDLLTRMATIEIKYTQRRKEDFLKMNPEDAST